MLLHPIVILHVFILSPLFKYQFSSSLEKVSLRSKKTPFEESIIFLFVFKIYKYLCTIMYLSKGKKNPLKLYQMTIFVYYFYCSTPVHQYYICIYIFSNCFNSETDSLLQYCILYKLPHF